MLITLLQCTLLTSTALIGSVHVAWLYCSVHAIYTVYRLRSGGSSMGEIVKNSTIRRREPHWKKKSALQKGVDRLYDKRILERDCYHLLGVCIYKVLRGCYFVEITSPPRI